jgi:hypothetical protein
MLRIEDFVQERVMEDAGTFGLYPPAAEAKAEFQRWRATRAVVRRG